MATLYDYSRVCFVLMLEWDYYDREYSVTWIFESKNAQTFIQCFYIWENYKLILIEIFLKKKKIIFTSKQNKLKINQIVLFNYEIHFTFSHTFFFPFFSFFEDN